jgi:polysaccharide export outer membrane protein
MNGRIITRQLLILVTAAIVMQGCALAPGMKARNTVEGKIEEENFVVITSLTMEMLKQMEADRRNQAEQVASELSEPHGSYLIGPGDVLNITVWDHPELTIPAGQFRDAETSGQLVGEDGYFFYPYVGKLRADGMTVSEMRDVLTEKLSTYINNPQLDVRVVGFRSKKVYVVGEVNAPGVLPLDDVPLMVADAISLSGGLTEDAYKSGVNISRDGTIYEIDLKAMYDLADASQNLLLKHGDIVNVLDRSQQKVFMMGEINRPSSVEIINGHLTLSAALGEAGGVRQISAEPGRIFVIRGSDRDNPQIFHLNAKEAYGLILAEQFEMQAQDIVFVDTAGISSWNRVISQLLPSISVIGIVDNVAQ